MHDYLISALLGVVEGITEFLPVSSTAHLRITQALLGLPLEDEYWKLFAIFIQLGAILAIVALYWDKLLRFARETFTPAFYGKGLMGMLRHPTGLLAIAFVATAGPAFLLKKVIGQNLESLMVMISSLVVGGVIMIVVDKIYAARGRTTRVEEMGPGQALWIGLVQTLSAVFPGTSRSMSTIAAGQIGGLTRAAALEFSFLVSVPVMVVATLYDLHKYKKEAGGIAMTAHQAGVLAVGFVISFIVAYFVVAWFLGYVRKHGFLPFGIYRILFGVGLYLYLYVIFARP